GNMRLTGGNGANGEKKIPRHAIRHLSFGILLSLGFRHSSFRPSLCVPSTENSDQPKRNPCSLRFLLFQVVSSRNRLAICGPLPSSSCLKKMNASFQSFSRTRFPHVSSSASP